MPVEYTREQVSELVQRDLLIMGLIREKLMQS